MPPDTALEARTINLLLRLERTTPRGTMKLSATPIHAPAERKAPGDIARFAGTPGEPGLPASCTLMAASEA